jgi:hypothetical protein
METAPVLESKETELSPGIDNTECEGVGNIMGHQRINIFGISLARVASAL